MKKINREFNPIINGFSLGSEVKLMVKKIRMNIVAHFNMGCSFKPN
jgi:hypothetical protein